MWIIIATIAEGGLRKWLLPAQLGNFLYFAKDVLAILFIIFNPIHKAQRTNRDIASAIILLGVTLLPWIFFGMINSPIAAVLTMKAILVWPLFAVYAASHAEKIDLEKIDRLLVAAFVINAIVGLLQSQSPPSAFINRQAWQSYQGMENEIPNASFGTANFVRASGTFSYLTGLTNFCDFGVLLFLWRSSVAESWLPVIGLLTACVCGLTTGARQSLAFVALGLISFPFLSRKSVQLLRILPAVLAALTLLLYGPLRPFSEAFWERWQNSGTEETLLGRSIPDFGYSLSILVSNPIGNGMGAVSQWTNFDNSSKGVLEGSPEDRIVRLCSEIGVMAIFVVIVTLMIPARFALLAVIRSGKQAMIALPLLGVIYSVFSGNLFFDHVAAALWWTVLPLSATQLVRRAPVITYGGRARVGSLA